ncbi:hypothetical protein KBD45_03950 [Candidatus Dojkabacteria bacterium]|nr:hypothetical protein [Candidatus Dojkabacteria bacterium]
MNIFHFNHYFRYRSVQKLLNVILNNFHYIFIFLVTALVVAYVLKLKFPHLSKTTVYVAANLQRADWWSSARWMPTELLSGINNGTLSSDGNIVVSEIRFFPTDEETWNKVKNRSFGFVILTIQADNRQNKFTYNNQELYAGNPLSIVINNKKLELLITEVQSTPITDNFAYYKFDSILYGNRIEYIKNYHVGQKLYDNNQKEYLEIIAVNKIPSKLTTNDQYGNPHLVNDPILYDTYLTSKVLAKETNGTLKAYDGSLLEINKSFVFNSPQLGRIQGWITDVQTTPLD